MTSYITRERFITPTLVDPTITGTVSGGATYASITASGTLTASGPIVKSNLVETAGTAGSFRFYNDGAGLINGVGTSAAQFDLRSVANFGWFTGVTPTLRMTLGVNGLGIGTTGAPTASLHVRGAGAASVTVDTAASLGATMIAQDTGNAVNNGGVVQFGAAQGYFAAIKGRIATGSNNTTGILSLQTRAVDTDVALTERLSITATGATTVTSASAVAFMVGPNGATNPAFQVRADTASMASGAHVTGGVAAGPVAFGVVSSATDASLRIDAKGTGTITLGNTSTGSIVVNRALTYGGVALANSVTGTGSMVLSNSPTFTGTPTGPGFTTSLVIRSPDVHGLRHLHAAREHGLLRAGGRRRRRRWRWYGHRWNGRPSCGRGWRRRRRVCASSGE
jgi:hypothetical protein